MTSSNSFAGDTFFGIDLKQIKNYWARLSRRTSRRVLLIDFGSTSITFAEANIQLDAISFDHVQRLKLPEDALERGVPAEPEKMAGLIRSYCQEANIPAHRAAVVLPHASAYTTLLQLPHSVPSAEALEYTLNPVSGVQIPVQLDQMDVDLLPLDLANQDINMRSYFLTGVPRKLIDRVIQTLQVADLELVRLQVGIFSQLQHLAPLLSELGQSSVLLHLELLRDCSLATLIGSSGPIKVIRLTGIRDFPEPTESSEKNAFLNTSNAEAQIIASDIYMPLSELDLRRLNQELRQFISECEIQFPTLCLERVALAGWNSAHPLLASLLQDALKMPVQVIHPLSTPGVGQFIPDQPMVLQGLGRLIGLGLSLMSNPTVNSRKPQGSIELIEFEQLPDMKISTPEVNMEPCEISPLEIAPAILLEEPLQEINSTEIPTFSFSNQAKEIETEVSAKQLLNEPKPIENTILDEDVPFSCGELFSSFEAKAEEPDDSAYLADDPSLWPSVAKVSEPEASKIVEDE